MKKEQITLMGCGWLGLPLCQRLSASGHNVLTTTTTLEKMDLLDKKIKTYLFDISQCLKENLNQELLNSDILIYTIPPLGEGEIENFFRNIDENKKIIFISSTSVYGKNQGEVNESSAFDPHSRNALVLREAEVFLKSRFKNLSIVRPGGLYDERRHPVYFLAGKTEISSGPEFLHLVHRDDCIDAISQIIEQNLIGEDFNLVNDLRILKKDYYTEKARELGLPLPHFADNALSNPTKISNDKSKRMLKISFKNQ